MNLYDLTTEYERLQEMLETEAEANDGAVSDELLEALTAAEGNITAKIEACAKVVRNLEAEHDAVDAEIARLDKKADSLEKNIKRLKEAVAAAMKRSQTQKVKTPLFTIWTQDRAHVEFEDETKLPRDWCRTEVVTKYMPDRKGMAKYIQEGGEIPGVELVWNTSLQIR